MENPFRKIFKKNEKLAKGAAVSAAIVAAVEGAEAQVINDAEQFLKDKNIKPEWNIDMRKYPGMHPAQAFEIESYEKLDLPGKIEWTKQAIEAENRNLKIDKDMGEGDEQIAKDLQEIQRLEQQLRDLERQNNISV